MATASVTTLSSETPTAPAIESTLLENDLSKLSAEQRLSYYHRVCESLGLNPLTKPFSYIRLNGKLVLYALKDATEQLRKLHGVSISSVSNQRLDDVFVVTATASDKTGRTDAATGAVSLTGLRGEALANALMKAETKAKRRVTLSICGLGMLDETEADSIPGAVVVGDEPAQQAPEGFNAWWEAFAATAAQGFQALESAWKTAPAAFRQHAQRAHRDSIDDLKAAAREVGQ